MIGNILLGVSVVLLLYIAVMVKRIWNHLTDETVSAAAPAAAPSVPAPAPVAAAPVVIPNHGELAAVISAALAEELGEDVSAIRIHSIRQLTPSTPAASGRQALVAAVSAVLAEELGEDVSAIRIHSLKQVA